MHPQVSNADIITPPESSLNSVATTLKDHVLRDWDVADIKLGVKRVRQTEIGVVREVFVSSGLFDALCHYRFGKRKWKPFRLADLTIKKWRPDFNGVWRKPRGGK